MTNKISFVVVSLLSILVIIVNGAAAHSFVGNQIIYPLNNNIIPNPTKQFEANNIGQDLGSITTEERIASFGYPVEMHDVITADGYILTMHRIPSAGNSTSPKRKPVLFQHGGFGDSFSWFFNYPDKIIPLRMADMGYDVWIANVRGTMYSRRHKDFSDRDRRFFEFSIDEIARYDIPAEIDYIQQVTGAEKLFFVGLSLGTPQLHMTLSIHPEYNQKLSLIISLAPTVYCTNTFPMIRIAANILGPIPKIVLDIVSGGTGEFPPIWMTKLMRTMGQLALESCSISFIGKYVCEKLSYFVYGGPTHPDKLKLIPLALSHAFSPISTKMADHGIQQIKTDKFQQYDYGDAGNTQVYGTTTPPLYFLKDTTAPTAVYYAENDFLVIPKDVARTVSELSNVVLFHRINAEHWNHVDFLTGQDVNELFTNDLIALFEKY